MRQVTTHAFFVLSLAFVILVEAGLKW